MKILVNGYNLRQISTGIANVIINTLNALVNKPNISLELVVGPVISSEILSRLSNKIKIDIIGTSSSFRWLMYDFPKYVNKSDAEYIWSPTPLLPKSVFRKNKKIIITVNDFVSKDFRSTMTVKGRLITYMLEKNTIVKADYLWCISKYTKSKLEEYYPKRKCIDIFVGCAPDSDIKRGLLGRGETDFFLSRFGIKKNYLLFVGSLEPRKNLSFLLYVFQEFHSLYCDMQLVIVGARKWGNTNIASIINSRDFPREDILFTQFISEKELMTLYSLAACYISTSLNEGFGLPQAEAMKCECPVVTAHNSAMIEVVEGAGITVQGWDVSNWCKAIETALKNKDEIILKQNERIKKYDWNLIIDNLINYLNL